jgi:hypothetical protein
MRIFFPHLIDSIFGLLAKVWARLTGQIPRLKLGWIYNNKNKSRLATGDDGEHTDAVIVSEGQSFRQKVLKEYAGKYQNSTYRILFHLPPSGVGIIWFEDLCQCLRHVGIASAIVRRDAPDFNQRWNSFQPNVFISMDLPNVLKKLDLNFILEYKKRHQCLRLFTPVASVKFPKLGLSTEDKWRLDLACSGRSVDAYFSMMAPEFFSEFWPEWVRAGFKYLTLPNGCNPFRTYPVEGVKEWDYFVVTAFSLERAQVMWQYMRPVMERYHGAWAGNGWQFGIGDIDPSQLPSYYARSRIMPAPLLPFLTRYAAETTERSFTATACGAFLITNWTPVTSRFFAPDELVCVKDAAEFEDAFEYYIDRPNERSRITLKGLCRTFNEHTYFHRIDELVNFFITNKEMF